jgi:hypothetical protein
MSWIERAQNNIIITTGDGQTWEPDYFIGSKTVDYNTTIFNFPGVEGSKVDRRKSQGAQYQLQLFFQGENNVEDSDAFELSARDSRPWNVSHPFYGELLLQPTKMKLDRAKFNVTEITVDVIETIPDDYPQSVVNVESKAQEFFESFASESPNVFNDVEIAPEDVNTLSENNDQFFEISSPKVTDQDAFNEYFNLFNEASNAILNATAEPLQAISKARAVISYPALLNETVRTRLNLFIEQLNFINLNFNNIETVSEKKIYENQAGNMISGMIQTAVTPLPNDYNNADDVLAISSEVINYYNDYLENINNLQTNTNDLEGSYAPSFESISILEESVFFMSSQLLNIALGAQQKRIFVLTEDSDVITLTHRFYGLDSNDENIDDFIRNNKIGINEMFEISKNREIIYYI